MNCKIAIIIPYFGKWPDWIDLFFHSCENNPSFDWYFFTDCAIPPKYRSNLNFKQTTFLEYCKNTSRELSINFTPKNPYKLCGLKPFEGYIHRKLIANYDFWGWADIDVVWGDLGKFYSEKLLQRYDVFSTHADRISGHLAILRNVPKYTKLCFQIPDWKLKLEDQKAFPLDEQDFSYLVYPESKYITKFYSKVIRKLFNWRDGWFIYYNFTPFLNRIFRIRSRKLFFKEQHTTPILGNDGLSFIHDSDTWIYKNGEIINPKSNKKYIYIHFMIYKKNSFRTDYFWKDNFYSLPNDYCYNKGVIINKNGFYITSN